MKPRRPLILDLDFTLLHLEFVPDSIEVPGRTRSAWIAPSTFGILHQLQSDFSLVLATARSFDGTKWVVEGLGNRGVTVENLVIEDGALWGTPDDLRALEPQNWVAIRALLEARRNQNWPDFEWQNDFRACLVLRAQNSVLAARLATILATHISPDLRIYRDGRKVYLLPKNADKWRALTQLLGENLASAAGVGDGENDWVWLPKIAFPATFARANSVLVNAVRARGGFVSQSDGHAGIMEILTFFSQTVKKQLEI